MGGPVGLRLRLGTLGRHEDVHVDVHDLRGVGTYSRIHPSSSAFSASSFCNASSCARAADVWPRFA